MICVFFFFFFKQKTAYEIYQCDWSSDVCSSDLEIFDIDSLNNDYIQAKANSSVTASTLTSDGASIVDDSDIVAFDGGARGTATTITEWTIGWDYFKSSRAYAADIIMSPFSNGTDLAALTTLFTTLRSTYQKYSFYIMPLPNEIVVSTISTKSALGANERGLAFY